MRYEVVRDRNWIIEMIYVFEKLRASFTRKILGRFTEI